MLFVALRPAGWPAVLAAVVLLCAGGIWAASRAEHLYARADDGRIVVDEVVGQLVALTPLLATSDDAVAGGETFFWIVTGFVAFRVFDIAKPGPVRWAERRFEGGVGVMADDLIAGLLAAAVLFASQLVVAAGGGA